MAPRIDEVCRIIPAPAARLWQAWFDAEQLVHWLPPGGMTGRVTGFDPRPGGGFGLELSYPEAEAAQAKSGEGRDEIGGRFVALDPPRSFAFEARFRSADPAFAGLIRMDWRFDPVPAGTRFTVTARDVPTGIGAEDHVAAISASLAQLADHVGAGSPRPSRKEMR